MSAERQPALRLPERDRQVRSLRPGDQVLNQAEQAWFTVTSVLRFRSPLAFVSIGFEDGRSVSADPSDVVTSRRPAAEAGAR